MDKEHISRDAFFAIYDFLDNDNGPRCLIDELDGFRYYLTLTTEDMGLVYMFLIMEAFIWENGLRVREMVGAFIIPADKYSGVNGVPEKRTEEDIFGK